MKLLHRNRLLPPLACERRQLFPLLFHAVLADYPSGNLGKQRRTPYTFETVGCFDDICIDNIRDSNPF